jgi:hypothetical protein
VVLIYKFPKGLKGFEEKTRTNLDSNWLDYRDVKHGSFMWIVTGFCAPLFLSSSPFQYLYVM